MGIPEEIRRIPRPKNTVVVFSGHSGARQYAVRERAGLRYGAKGNPQPINGRVIGHIVNGQFIALNQSVKASLPSSLSYGAPAFVHSCEGDLMEDLYAAFSVTDAQRIMVIASLRVLKPRISARRLNSEYQRSFLSLFYPGVALSENTVSSFFQDLGKNGARRRNFYERRIAKVEADHHIAIDGTLKQDTSTVNDLSAFSRKARVKGCRDISVLYAYDIEKKEPICAEVFPGNCIDSSSYRSFILDNNIQKGIVISDKGFPPSQIADELSARPQLHFLTPIKRNDGRIKTHNMLDYEGVLNNSEQSVYYKKAKVREGRFLYSFRDTRRAALEERSFAERARGKDRFDKEKYDKKKLSFGVIIFESDLDLPAEDVYRCYADRWQIELVFRHYKNDDCLDQTGVQGDFSVIGSEFVNFIATTLTCRMIGKAQDVSLLEEDSWRDLLDDLSSAWRLVAAAGTPKENDEGWVHTLKKVKQQLKALGLCIPEKQEQELVVARKPGRRKGSKVSKKPAQGKKETQSSAQPKRGPGRPKGSKNKKTLEREAREREKLEAEQKKKATD